MSGVPYPYAYPYVAVAATSTTTLTAPGGYVQRALVVVTTATEGTAKLVDGSTTLFELPADVGKGVYNIELNTRINGNLVATCSGISRMTLVGLFTANP
jgi:hypothetical protein